MNISGADLSATNSDNEEVHIVGIKTDEGYISKERFAQQEISRGLAQASTENKIRVLYDNFCQTGASDILNDLILNTERLVAGIVCSALSRSAYFTGDVEDALQDISLQFVSLVTADQQSGTRQPDIIKTIRSLYKKRSIDIVRSQYRENKDRTLLSLDELNTDQNGKIRDRFGANDEPTDEDRQLSAEKGDLSRRLLEIYLRTMLDYRNDPQKPLGLCFGRILYQLEMLYNPDEIELAGIKKAAKDKRKKISDYDKMLYAFWDVQSPATATSLSWAARKMDSKNLGMLSIESQNSLQAYFNPSLKWGKNFLARLQVPSPYKDGIAWKYVIYTDEFTPKQTSDWTESIHRSVFNASLEVVESDSLLLDEVLGSDLPFKTMMEKVKGGKRRESHGER